MNFLPLVLFASSVLILHGGGLRAVDAKPGGVPRIETLRFKVNTSEAFEPFIENAYLVVDSEHHGALLIDPGSQDDQIDAYLSNNGIKLGAILNTHGHMDHTAGNEHYARAFKVKVYAHALDRPMILTDPALMVFLDQEGPVTLGGFRLTVIHVPGHTPGSVAYLLSGALFTGDTLFRDGIGAAWGRTKAQQDDSIQQELHGIRNKLLTLPGDTAVHPGHGEATSISRERTSHAFLKPGALPHSTAPSKLMPPTEKK